MPGNEQREETDEEFLARLAANRARRKAAKLAAEEAAKPKLEVTVSPKLAEAVKANPDTLRVSAKAADETMFVERPRTFKQTEVLAVDTFGRPARVWQREVVMGEMVEGVVDYENGYSRLPSVRSEYNPMDGLRRPEDE